MHISRENLEDVVIVLIIILIGIGSFGLGRLSVENAKKEPLQILEPEALDSQAGLKNNL